VRTLVAVSGIVIGGTMIAATFTGRHLAGGIHRRRDEIEAWLVHRPTPRQALRDIARCAIVEALVPVLDTTRTVGLVTLSGAFAGALRRPGLAALTANICPLPGLSGSY
jgi:putative ABC transport system permease protein